MSRAVPELRFPEFTGDWRAQKLSAVLKSKGKRNKDLQFGPEHVLSVSGELGVVNQIEHLGRSYAGASVAPYHIVETGDIVYTKSPLKANPFGIIKVNRGAAGIVSTLYAVYEVRTGHDPIFWDRYFELDDRTNRYLKPLVNKGAKNDMKISNERVLIDPVIAPALDEQQKIAAFLNATSRKITLLSDKKTALEDYKRGLMQRLFSRELRFTRDDGSAFPDWEERKLGEFVSAFSGGTPTVGREAYYGGEIPFIKSAEISRDRTSEYLSELGLKKSAARLIEKGDLLVALYGANAGEVAFSKLDGAINQAVLCVRSELDLSFAFHFLGWKKNALRARYLQGGQGNFSGAIVKAISMPFPHPDEQRKIAAALSALDAKIDALSQKISEMEAFKKGLLQKLFV